MSGILMPPKPPQDQRTKSDEGWTIANEMRARDIAVDDLVTAARNLCAIPWVADRPLVPMVALRAALAKFGGEP